ncbi:MAG: DUF2911 domain-containing protein [Agriterribacter sp.]
MKKRRKIFFVCLVIMLATNAFSQETWPPVDNSPMDMIYFPVDYPILKIRKQSPPTPVIRITYSRPMKKNRKIFGELVEYNNVWRLGANEATEIDFYKDVKIGNTKIKKGNYTMYAITSPEKWTIIINRENDIWGSFAYDIKKDVLRTDVKTGKTSEPVETFSMQFEKTPSGANLLIAWEDVKVSLPINF